VIVVGADDLRSVVPTFLLIGIRLAGRFGPPLTLLRTKRTGENQRYRRRCLWTRHSARAVWNRRSRTSRRSHLSSPIYAKCVDYARLYFGDTGLDVACSQFERRGCKSC
jgi:hypothetical protein